MGSALSDGDLVRLARSGDAVAFRLLVERYRPMALARALRLGVDAQGADDVVQEAFLQAFVSLDRLRDPQRFAAWLGGIVVNVHRAALRRRESVILLDEWPDQWHPASPDGLPDAVAESLDRAQALTRALESLPAGQREAVELFYYADLPVEQVASYLAGTPGAVKARLHKARARLREYITAHRPDLIPLLPQRTVMTAVRLARAVPQPDEQHIHHVAVVLVDDVANRALPLWVMGIQIHALRALLQEQGGAPARVDDLTGRLLSAAGAQVTAVDIDELGPEVTVARIELDGPEGTRHVTAQLAEGLSLAVAYGAPIRVADALMDQLAQPLRGDDPFAPLLERTRPATAAVPGPRRRRLPRNLAFDAGLDGWELRGSFLRDITAAHWHDYYCEATGQGSAILGAAVPAPYGFADLRQAVQADDYRGHTVHFRGLLRAEQVSEKAGLYLRVVTDHTARNSIDQRVVATVGAAAADDGWALREVSTQVPHDARSLLFGLTLTGPGKIELRDAEVTSGS